MSTAEFPIYDILERCAESIKDKAPAAMFGLRDEGYDSLYEQLISCILSIRTYDEVSTVVSRKLFAKARTPEAMLQLSRTELSELIQESTFPEQKVDNILQLSRDIVEQHNGRTPATFEGLTTFKGVGPKCANLALGVALNVPAISVDVHVHRITNRWGYVSTKTPEKTRQALEKILPKDLWIEINRVLVPFGKHVCQGRYPKCSRCPVQAECAQIGVV
ncbi:MAG: endonuclease III [Bacteroidota bacterium]